MTRAPDRANFLAVLRVGEFRALWSAELLSVLGDQLARVALAVLVFQRTDSAALTGLTYALTFVPTLVGGVLFGGWGDRRPRRDVLVLADLVRAALMGAMVVPGLPLSVLCVLVAAMTLLGGPFRAAQQALLPDVLPGDLYLTGMALRNLTGQSAQVLAFAGGGVLVAAVAPTTGLAIDAATFAASAILIRTGVRRRPAPDSADGAAPATGWREFGGRISAGARTVWGDPVLRVLVALNWLAGFYIVPEAVAAPYAASLGAGAAAVGWLMAADPIGSVVGAVVFGRRWVPEPVQVRALGLLGVCAGIPLVLCVAQPGLGPAMLLFALSGMLATGYNIQGTVTFVRRLPDARRAQGSGLNTAGLITVQGLGAAAAGVVADLVGPAHTVAIFGAAGALVAVPIAATWRRVQLLSAEGTAP